MQASSPLVSIITITYNASKYLQQAINSVAAQSYPYIEYIIIDGGSDDDSVSIIKRNSQVVSKWLSEKDRGISNAFNKGLALATGDIVGIINADDCYERDTVKLVVENMNGYDIVYGDLRFHKNGKPDFILKGDHSRLTSEMTVNHPTVFVRKEIYNQYGLFDESYKCAMDYDLLLRLMVNNCRFKYIPSVLANMQWNGVSDRQWMNGCRETLHIKNKYLPDHQLQHRLYFFKHVLAIALPKYLQKIGMGLVVKTYRKYFAMQKKVYN